AGQGGCHARRDDPRPDQPPGHDASAREPALRAERDRALAGARQGRGARPRLRRRDRERRLRHARRGGRERRGQGRDRGEEDRVTTELEVGLYIFMLAGFLGYHIITRIPPLLHTPLMSATNAIAAISLVGSLVVAGSDYSNVPNGWVCTLLGFLAVTCSSTNAVGGFLITDRMLRMFKTAEQRASGVRRPVELQAFAFVLAVVAAATAVLYATKPAGMAMGEYLHAH